MHQNQPKKNDPTGADLGEGWIGWLANPPPPYLFEEAKKKVLAIGHECYGS